MGLVKEKSGRYAKPFLGLWNPVSVAFPGNTLIRVLGERNSTSFIAKVCGKGCEAPLPPSTRAQRRGGDCCCRAKPQQCFFLWTQASPSTWLHVSHVFFPCFQSLDISLGFSSGQIFAKRVFQIPFEPQLMSCQLKRRGSEPMCLHLFMGMPRGAAC